MFVYMFQEACRHQYIIYIYVQHNNVIYQEPCVRDLLRDLAHNNKIQHKNNII